MKDGFIRVASATVEVKVADIKNNVAKICEKIKRSDSASVNLLVLPELCITGYTCGDLFLSQKLADDALEGLKQIRNFTVGRYPIVVVGLPISYCGKLYNCAAVLQNGKILGIVPKDMIPNYNEFYERRYFASGSQLKNVGYINIDGQNIKIGSVIFKNNQMPNFTFAVEICEDLWVTDTPATQLCRNGAFIIANLSASNELTGKADFRKNLVVSASSRLFCGYIYANADSSESTQDAVYSRHNIICEHGVLLAENKPFGLEDMIFGEIDVNNLALERRRNTAFVPDGNDRIDFVEFDQEIRDTQISRMVEKNPFIPKNDDLAKDYAETALNIQTYGLKKRIEHTNAKTVVIGISGGLDSTLALLVAVRTMKLLSRPLTDILAVTMPCFGTTNRTKSNAIKLCELLGVTIKEVDITQSVLKHFDDIGQSSDNYDVTYENAQARERTQVLMDLANMNNGLVIGTGDLSELALGWATYNGDQMSMYGVNASVPKTLVRHIVKHVSNTCQDELSAVLTDIIDTPVSPELLPASDGGEIAQKTENSVGPYELHDFFLYHMIKLGESPKKIYRLAKIAFNGVYDDQTIVKWLYTFTKRFFTQQFKRSCMPDGPKVCPISLSPRSDWRMPSDACAQIWLDEIEQII